MPLFLSPKDLFCSLCGFVDYFLLLLMYCSNIVACAINYVIVINQIVHILENEKKSDLGK